MDHDSKIFLALVLGSFCGWLIAWLGYKEVIKEQQNLIDGYKRRDERIKKKRQDTEMGEYKDLGHSSSAWFDRDLTDEDIWSCDDGFELL